MTDQSKHSDKWRNLEKASQQAEENRENRRENRQPELGDEFFNADEELMAKTAPDQGKHERHPIRHPEKHPEKQPGQSAKTQQEALEFPSREQFEAQLNDLEDKVNKYKTEILSKHAELDNVRKRAERDVRNAHLFGNERLLSDLLPVIESFELGLAKANENKVNNEGLWQGMQLTYDLFKKVLEKFGVEEINPIGEVFNPDRHQAMLAESHKDVKPNTIVKVMQKGYQLNGRLLRPALVVVAK